MSEQPDTGHADLPDRLAAMNDPTAAEAATYIRDLINLNTQAREEYTRLRQELELVKLLNGFRPIPQDVLDLAIWAHRKGKSLEGEDAETLLKIGTTLASQALTIIKVGENLPAPEAPTETPSTTDALNSDDAMAPASWLPKPDATS